MGTPIISVIVPVYNIAPYIGRCLDSILAQTYRQMEIIAVDDGSADGSGQILDDYAQRYPNVRVFHKENGGVTSARLFGVSQAVGEYIGFVDGDDIIESDMYEHLMDNLLQYHADISHCGYQMVFPDRVDYYYNTGDLAQQDHITALKELLCGSRIEPGLCNKLFHKSLFHSLLHEGKMDTSIRNTEDLLMNFWLFKASAVSVYEDFCPYHYMVRGNSAATGKLSAYKLSDPIRVQRILLEETKDQPELQRIIYGRLATMYSGGAEMALGEQPELIRPHRRMCRRELWKLLPRILFGHYDRTSKIHSLLAAFCPFLCRKVHELYAKRKGTYDRYRL